MKLKISAVFLSLMLVASSFGSCNECCNIRLTGALVQEILDAINIIKPTVISIKIEIEELATCCAILNSKIDLISISGIEEITTCCDILNSKIGELNQDGTCLDSIIDVPDDINNLNLTIIQLLKTILLELRGCSPC